MQGETSHSIALKPSAARWLAENGPRELELLFRAIVYHPATPILIADDNRKYREASAGAGKLLGIPREKIIGHKVDDFAEPESAPHIPEIWDALLEEGEQEGTLCLKDQDGNPRVVEFKAKANVLPVRHVLTLREKAARKAGGPVGRREEDIPPWVQDFALYLLDEDGSVAAWYGGATRIYGYGADDAMGRNISFLYTAEDNLNARLREELRRSADAGHFGNEGWQVRKDGSRLWANVITTALRNEKGELQGFARIVRDFSDRHDSDEKLRRSRLRQRPIAAAAAITGVVSGEFDRIPEANDTFLELVGYSREDLREGRLQWLDLTPPEYAPLDELAHEEGLRFGACTPYEKELIRQDGTRIPVRVATAVLRLSPFQWIAFVQDLRARDRVESVEEEEEDSKVRQDFDEIVGDSAAMKRVERLIEVVAPTDATVLILGETGTGKELVARAIHRMSPRKNLPFVTLNCAAIPTGLLESELFGYERGAFTGALQQKIGRFEMANRGTLFLDEVGDIPLDLQPKLLRALQEKAFERLGGTKTIPIDVRLVAATNRNLTQMMGDKLFRSDLYYRLKVFPILTPLLRDHAEDIPVLARYFTRKYAARMGRQIDKIPSDTMKALVAWHWPGNVRELENFMERSVILTSGSSLRAPLAEIRPDAHPAASDATLEQVERDHILRVLRESGGVVTLAATRLGLHRTTLNAMMRKLGISRNDL
ncbi:MAG: sigma 54-interacting transcriptional regulator [Bryobacteraceae bacterium]|jgi:PAS domain S-box-containing protein